jgi:integrase
MGSVVTRANGCREVRFTGLDGKPATVRLGRVTKIQAKEVQMRIQRLVGSHLSNTPVDDATARWVGGLLATLRERLANHDLIPQQAVVTVGHLLEDFEAARSAVSASTRLTRSYVAANLRTYFGEERPLRSITAADAHAFADWLRTSGGKGGGPQSEATASRRVGRAQEVFLHAKRREWLTASPFEGLRTGSQVNRDKDFRVTVELFERVIAEIPDAEFQGFVVLIRFGALRPCEAIPLEWVDVNWEHRTIVVRRRKTKQRAMPLWPDIQEALEPLWEAAAEGEPLVFPGLQMTVAGLRKRLGKACRAAGVPLWPRPWKNMRATRETELVEQYPLPVVVDWIGHTPAVAQNHYWQVFSEHHKRAVASESILKRTKKRTNQDGPTRSTRSSVGRPGR